MNAENIKPAFLKKLDNYLLTHFPAIWQSKIIWVAFYSFSLFGLFYFFGDRFDYEPEYDAYYYEGKDRLFFSYIPMFLTVVMVFYWLYVQFQQKIDYSKLSIGGFVGITLLNFLCISLMFLPALGLAYSTFDLTRTLTNSLVTIQVFLTMATAGAVLPFIIRQHSIIEVVLVVFAGVIYCFGVGLTLSFTRVNYVEGINAIYVVNLLLFVGIVVYKFATKTYSQQTKRIALLCLLALPIAFPTFLHYAGMYYSLDKAYESIFSRRTLFSVEWLVGNILVLLVVYGIAARFLYRSMLFPIKRK